MDQRSQPVAQLERDAAIARIGRTRRWLIVAAAGLTAGFTAIISAVAPGRSFASHSDTAAVGPSRPVTSTSTAAARASTKLPPLESAQALGLAGPAQAPQASPAPGSAGPSSAAPAPSQVSPAQTQAPAPVQSTPPVVSGGS